MWGRWTWKEVGLWEGKLILGKDVISVNFLTHAQRSQRGPSMYTAVTASSCYSCFSATLERRICSRKRTIGNCLTRYLLSWFDICLNVLKNRLQVVFISNTQIFNLDFTLLGPVFGDLRGIWNSYRNKQTKCYQRVTFCDIASVSCLGTFLKLLKKQSPSSPPRGSWELPGRQIST